MSLKRLMPFEWCWEEKIDVKEVENKRIKVSLEELLYYGFLVMALFTKGIGLDEGTVLFRTCLFIGILLLGCKFLVGKYSVREIVVIGILGIWGIFIFRSTGSLGMLIYVLMAVGMKNVPVRRAFRVGVVVWGACMFFSFTAAIFAGRTGVRLVHEKLGLGPLLRESLGYTHPNVLHITYIVFMAFVLYFCKARGKKLAGVIVLLLLGDAYVFSYSLSFTGLLFSFILLAVFFYFRGRKQFTGVESMLIQGVPFLCVAVSIVLPQLLEDGTLYKLVNGILNNRVWAIKTYFRYYDVPWVGATNGDITFSLDNSYVSALSGYGIIPLCFLITVYFFVIRYYLKKNRREELTIICTFLIAGLSEPFLFNASVKNITMLFIGEYLFKLLSEEGNAFSFLSGYNKLFVISEQHLYKTLQKMEQVNWKKIALVVGTVGIVVFVFLIPQECVKIDHVYADERLCDVGGETISLPSKEGDERTLYIGLVDSDTNYYYFTRENSKLIDTMELRMKISISLYVAAGGGALLGGWMMLKRKE